MIVFENKIKWGLRKSNIVEKNIIKYRLRFFFKINSCMYN